MRNSGRLCLALPLFLACAPQPAPPVDTTEADTAAINSVREQEVTAINTADTTLGYAAEDIVLMPPNEPAVVGIPAVRAWFGGLMAQFKVSVDYTDSKLALAGNSAVEQYSATFTLTPVAGGPPVTETLKGLHVYRRDAAGAWKMVQDIWNADAAPAPAATP